jgi:CDP-glucose 4,6-dehydratase
MIDKSFWAGRRVLITGHTGFKGTWLAYWLLKMGADVIGLAQDPPTSPSLYNLSQIGTMLDDNRCDIRNRNEVERVVSNSKPDIVFHLAAQPLVRHSYKDPVLTFETNIIGTVNILEAVRRVVGIEAFINITTDKVYSNKSWVWGYREIDEIGCTDPYSSSKACSELVTESYRTSFFNNDMEETGLKIASARAGNVIGGGDWALDRLIPDVVKSFKNKYRVDIRNPYAIRPWQHVLQPLSGYLVLAEKLASHAGREYCEAWNFGPYDSDAKTVSWIVENMAKLWGQGTEWTQDRSEQPHEMQYLKLDISKAITKLDWRPKITLIDALESIVYFHKNLEDDPLCHMDTMIDKYFSLETNFEYN